MTAYRDICAHRLATGYRPPTGPDRCPTCGWHTPTMGHPDGCPNEQKDKEHR